MNTPPETYNRVHFTRNFYRFKKIIIFLLTIPVSITTPVNNERANGVLKKGIRWV